MSQKSEPESSASDEAPLEGGLVEGVKDELPFHAARHTAETKKRLAFLLIWILALSVLLHYGALTLLYVYHFDNAAEQMAKVFNIWLPLIAGLSSSAVTYYFAKER